MDAIRKIVNIAVLLKHVQIAHGMNAVAGLIYMSRELNHKRHFYLRQINILITTILPQDGTLHSS
jgi:hypothetical protein